MNKIGVYTITNLINNKIYVGSCLIPFKKRKNNHFSQLNRSVHHNIHLQRAYNKYGKENFEFEILEYCEEEYIESSEQYWINLLNVTNQKFGYNILSKARNSKGYKHTKECKEKLSIIKKEYYKNNISKLLGKKYSEEQKKESKINRKPRPKGIFPSKETRKKYRNAQLGKKRSEITKNKIRVFNLGKESKCKKKILQLTLNDMFIKKYNSLTEAGKENNIKGIGNISKCCNNKLPTAYGYKWKYENSNY